MDQLNQLQKNQLQKNKVQQKLVYQSPLLKKYGKLKDITFGIPGSGTDGGAGFSGTSFPG